MVSEMKTSEWYEPHQKPERVGLFEALVYDAGWTYEWLVCWDGRHWRSSVDGNTLIDQNLKWRGLTTEQTE
jgi:hypothetical protein